MALLSVQNLSIGLKPPNEKSLVKDISFEINKGEMVALVGESGSGKSLTALSIMRLLNRNFQLDGRVVFNGRDVLGAPEAELEALRGNSISMIFQEPMTALNPLHTIGKQIGEMYTSCGERSDSAGSLAESMAGNTARDPAQSSALKKEQRIHRILQQVGLAHFKDRLDAYPHQLSGGERQRVMIAMAIANTPDLLIADEPTTAVDVTVQAQILTLLKQLQKEMGMAMLFITHDLTLVEKLADRVMVMRRGELVEQGKVADVFSNPQHAYTQTLLSSKPTGSAVALASDAPILLEAEKLRVAFPIKTGVLRRVTGHTVAVEQADIQLQVGETLGVVGESGSGKTTLAMALLRMVTSEGRIVFMGQDVSALKGRDLKPLRAEMQLVFQDPFSSLNPRMTVGQIIGEGLLAASQPDDRRQMMDVGMVSSNIQHPTSDIGHEARIAAMLKQVGLTPDMVNRYPHEFSGGQRQRISIARAMILEPKLVILDEPTSALDLTVQSQILDLLKAFQTEQGISTIFITHDLRVIRTIAHRVMVMKAGQVVESGETTTLFDNPQTDYTRQLIAASEFAS